MRTKSGKKKAIPITEHNRQRLEFGKRLREVRAELNIRPMDFIEKLGLGSATMLPMIENGGGIPAAEILIKLAELYPVDLHYLLTGKPCPGIAIELQALRDVKHRYRMLWAKIASQAVKVTDVEKHIKAIVDELELITRPVKEKGENNEQKDDGEKSK